MTAEKPPQSGDGRAVSGPDRVPVTMDEVLAVLLDPAGRTRGGDGG